MKNLEVKSLDFLVGDFLFFIFGFSILENARIFICLNFGFGLSKIDGANAHMCADI